MTYMDKEIIVKLLQKDISELAQLTQGFDEMENLPAVLLQLAGQKATAIVENLQLLAKQNVTTPAPDETTETASTGHEQEKEETKQPQVTMPADEPQPVAATETEIQEETAVREIHETEPETSEEKEEEAAGQTNTPDEVNTVEKTTDIITQPDEKETPVAENTARVQEEKTEKHFFQHEVVTRNDSLQHKVDDVKQAISIGDRFLFQRELFGGNGELMSKTITVINACKDLESAEQYLTKKFNWNPDNPATERFMQIVRRKF